LALTISLGREPLSSYADPIAQSSAQPVTKIAQAYLDYAKRALEKQNRGDNRGAIADYNEAIRLKPDYFNAYNNRGNAKSALGDYRGAIADYNKAIRLKPDKASTYNNRGNAKSELGDKQGAIAF
jgi:tetratricopeptide (TPR) repeat protein